MGRWSKRIRGAIGLGLTWAAAWFAAGMVLLVIVGPDAADVPFPLGFGLLGFLAGATFSVIVGIAENRRRFDQISMPRFAGWGALGGLLFSGVFALAAGLAGEFLILGPLFAIAGAGSAVGTLALARRADSNALPDSAKSALLDAESRDEPGGRR